ncbi:WD40-repeat-containing domain protein [Phascolomyces articulosus]|uniref:DNA damage-binding protein CMR1 n=1 Tax=Phascolomyces articulosus TaxID=60185 RepID=A0AAD5PEL7_9FUNG|nr:WD40-repeat-containing domain protein [Phascolomyces articulosus]
MSLSEYEKQRLENIERNNELLRQLDIPRLKLDRKRSASPSPSTIKKHVPKKQFKEKQAPTRVSARLRGIAAENAPDHTDAMGETDVKKKEEAKRVDTLEDTKQKEFMQLLDDIRRYPNLKPDEDIKPVKKEDQDTQERLQQEIQKLKVKHTWATVKVTPDRINGCLFHPSSAKILACAADVSGSLGFWDVNNFKKDEEDEDEEPVVFTYRPHTRGITNMLFDPTNSDKLYTSSYDGTLRYFDMKSASFGLVDFDGERIPFTNFDITQDGHNVWYSTLEGQVGFRDLRIKDGPAKLDLHQLRDKKVGCVHLNPVNQNLMAVASNDRTMTVWDIRSLSEQLHEFSHGYSVTSAYWSPRGDKLVTASYDDYIRLFDYNDSKNEMKLQTAIRHNNHTGRWVTNFRARWHEGAKDHQLFLVGNMKHPVDIFSGETGGDIGELYDGERITAIQAVAQFHPATENMMVVTGNGSGRMVCYS